MSRSAQPPAISSASRELIDSVLDAVVQAVQAVHVVRQVCQLVCPFCHCDAWRRKWCVAGVVEENVLLHYCNLV